MALQMGQGLLSKIFKERNSVRVNMDIGKLMKDRLKGDRS